METTANRQELLKRLKIAAIGLTNTEVLEQSDSFVFHDGKITTFNDSVLVRQPGFDKELTAVVKADLLLKMLERLPDDEITLVFGTSELVVKGKRRSAGIPLSKDVRLPLDSVPSPVAGKPISKEVLETLSLAARACGRDETQPVTTCVRVTEKVVEGCDNFRLFYAQGKTGFTEEVLIPASAIADIGGLKIKTVGSAGGWCHFMLDDGYISVRCINAKYPNTTSLLDVQGESVKLPAELVGMIERSSVFVGPHDSRVKIDLSNGKLVLESRQDDVGWYKERKKIDYSGPPLSFEVNPELLVWMMKHSQKITVDKGKIGLRSGNIQVVMVMFMTKDEAEEN